MQTRRLNEGLIGAVALGKLLELGRQVRLVSSARQAARMGQKLQVRPQRLQAWGRGYILFDALISLAGILGMAQGMRRNRKGAGQAAMVQGLTLLVYSLYYLLYSLFGLKGAKARSKLVNTIASIGHGAAAVAIVRFARRALA